MFNQMHGGPVRPDRSEAAPNLEMRRRSAGRKATRAMPTMPFQMLKRRLAAPSRAARETARDRALAERLGVAFERDLELADVQGIHFYVQHGTVTLYGTVRHELDRDLLVSLVRQVPGVKSIVPHLQIQDPFIPTAEPVTFHDHTD